MIPSLVNLLFLILLSLHGSNSLIITFFLKILQELQSIQESLLSSNIHFFFFFCKHISCGHKINQIQNLKQSKKKTENVCLVEE